MNSHKHEHVARPVGDKDSEILEEDREFNKEDSRAIDNCHKIAVLEALSVNLMSTGFGQIIVRKVI